MSADAPRRPGRPGSAPPPRAASPAIAVVVTLVAAVLGFFILKSLDSNGSSSSNPSTKPTDATTTTLATDTTPSPVPTTVDKSSFQLLVANASGVKGSAATMSSQLQTLGYRVIPPSNTVPGYAPKDVTEVFFLPGFELQGADVAANLGVQALPMPATKPVADTDFTGATVLVALGKDLAGKTISGGGVSSESTVAGASSTIAGSPNGATTSSTG
jgi:hypothetical protein